MNILLMSGTGLLGSYLRKNLLDPDADFFWTTRGKPTPPKEFNCELTYSSHVKHVIRETRPNTIIISAANPNSKFNHEKTPEMVADNVMSVANILSEAPFGTHIVYFSSVLVYGNKYVKCDEESSCSPISVYASTKLAAEHLLQSYVEQSRIKLTIFRLSQVVGPNLRRGLLYDIINKVKGPSNTIELFGKYPGSHRPVSHLEDITRITRQAITDEIEGTFNLCTSNSITVENMARVVMDEYHLHKTIEWDENAVWKGDSPKIFTSNDRLVDEFGELTYGEAESAVKEAARVN